MTRIQLQALTILADGPAVVSNRTCPDARTVSARTADSLEQAGLAINIAGYKAIITDAGRKVAADPPAVPERRYEHGTHACYTLDACRCLPCRRAGTSYESRRRRDEVYGRPRTVDAEPVRQHVRDLMCEGGIGSHRMGVGLKQIAKVSGVSHGALWKLVYGAPGRAGPSQKVRASTAQRLLAVTMADMADGATVPADATHRRIRDLRAAGATWRELGEQWDMEASNLCSVLQRRNVTAGTARKVADLHDRWQTGQWEPAGRQPGGRWKAKLQREATDAV